MKRFFLLMILCAAVVDVHAKVMLPSVIGDNMVLQQQSDVALWGMAKPDSKVIIAPSWTKKKTVVRSEIDGKWFVRVSTPQAGGPYEIVFDDGDKTVVSNVLIGEVWICSGQSNMRMPMQGFDGQPVKGASELIVTARPSLQVRLCRVKESYAQQPAADCRAQWKENVPEAVSEFSAASYYFARLINQALDVPVGVIDVSWGGSMIESWMEKELLEKEFPGEFDLSYFQTGILPVKNANHSGGTAYNGMLAPIIPYTAKGFLWYQGCANVTRPDQYMRLQPAFVRMLREKWSNEDMPFYFAQIAPYGYSNKPEAPMAGLFMDAQARTLEMIPNSGMVPTHDVGEQYSIHPAHKQEVGHRFAFLALANQYGVKGIDAHAPLWKTVKYENGKAIMTFKVGHRGLSPNQKDIGGFELAGADKVFYPATARISKDGKTLTVRCPQVPDPVAVRYGIHNYSEATVFNCAGIPLSPFRTDDW